MFTAIACLTLVLITVVSLKLSIYYCRKEYQRAIDDVKKNRKELELRKKNHIFPRRDR